MRRESSTSAGRAAIRRSGAGRVGRAFDGPAEVPDGEEDALEAVQQEVLRDERRRVVEEPHELAHGVDEQRRELVEAAQTEMIWRCEGKEAAHWSSVKRMPCSRMKSRLKRDSAALPDTSRLARTRSKSCFRFSRAVSNGAV